jgi:hypothetical protein
VPAGENDEKEIREKGKKEMREANSLIPSFP